MFEIPATSLTLIRVPIKREVAGVVTDPTGYTVQMALTAPGGTVTYQTATWQTDTTTDPDTYLACCLVGPGGTVTLTAGVIYQIHVKVTASPEIPVIHGGQVKAVSP